MINMRLAVSRERGEVAQSGDQIWERDLANRIDVHVGQRLRARRVEVGLSQAALGRHLGVTFSQVQKYEKGTNRIGAGRLYQLAALLGIPVQHFFDDLEEPKLCSLGRGAASSDAGRIQEALARISDPNARQALLSLASSMARSG
ncbi:helix-turn-helix transcriptional regulator [Amaricoccus sp.]|uniref:helix-turn-helix domain-containing protein n=1 Tax=Amaricoccus sp. TaxID=1872485 RepID=UPI002622DB68|nr:helix-turn-helix transcriptional regulator [uncultured Amaricoccus sp.]